MQSRKSQPGIEPGAAGQERCLCAMRGPPILIKPDILIILIFLQFRMRTSGAFTFQVALVSTSSPGKIKTRVIHPRFYFPINMLFFTLHKKQFMQTSLAFSVLNCCIGYSEQLRSPLTMKTPKFPKSSS